MRPLLMLAALIGVIASAAPPVHFQPQAFLAGSCWKGTFPDGKQVDEHCFEWVYDGQFLRDRHNVIGGQAPYGGESIYYFDESSKTVRYLYINVLGGHSGGSVSTQGDTLVFPEEKYSDGSGEQVYRSSWRRDGDDAYLVVTEQKVQDRWKEAWRVRMQRQ